MGIFICPNPWGVMGGVDFGGFAAFVAQEGLDVAQVGALL
jgi:hypothetical protein